MSLDSGWNWEENNSTRKKCMRRQENALQDHRAPEGPGPQPEGGRRGGSPASVTIKKGEITK